MRKVKSVKGDTVDFDLLEIKQQLDSNPPEEIRVRERFIDTRKRRGFKPSPEDMIVQQKASKERVAEILKSKSKDAEVQTTVAAPTTVQTNKVEMQEKELKREGFETKVSEDSLQESKKVESSEKRKIVK
jgi:hypothetical protein